MRALSIGLGAVVLLAAASVPYAQSPANSRPTIKSEEDFRRAFKELSNWGRWGKDDELGAANFITPEKRKQAVALVKEGVAISMEHDVPQELAADTTSIMERTLLDVNASGSVDRYAYTGSYHSVVHSHMDAVDCHVMVDGKGYNGVTMEEIKAIGGCPKGAITALKDGVVTRGILFDATKLPGKASPQGWLEPGTAIHREDLEALEKLEHVKVSAGDVILLYTGRWKRRAALGAWPATTGFAGYHSDVAYFLKERSVSFTGTDGPNDVLPSGYDLPSTLSFPYHRLALASLGVDLFDNLDYERAVEEARRLNRYEFLFSAAPLRVDKGTGSPLNPLAIF
ncbi:MAG TPA: cyclase family protein [Bryobacteraceae bacterium]|nr:cyclase family protein [Bryobacteraceae bacterium]